MVYPALLLLLLLMRTPRLPVAVPPANLNGLVRFAERPNLVSARVPSRFKRAVPHAADITQINYVLFNSHNKYYQLLPSATLTDFPL